MTTREEERRRLRRDLHDGLGPVLASQGLKIAAVRYLLGTDRARCLELLDELAAQNESTVSQIRRLVYTLRPPELDELGLPAAVRDFAAGMSSSSKNGEPMEIQVHASDGTVSDLPAAIEVAAYRIATEALTNGTRHARARNCTVDSELTNNGGGGEFRIEVIDNGVGFPEEAKGGVGMNSMRERAEELRGEFAVETTPGRGNHIMARFPLR